MFLKPPKNLYTSAHPSDDMAFTEEQAKEERKKIKKMISPEEQKAKEAALKEAEKLEKEHLPTAQEETEQMGDFSEEAEDAQKLLTPLDDIEQIKTKKKKS